jgi:hypothetical protein
VPPSLDDGAKLTVEELEAVSAGYEIRTTPTGAYEVVNDEDAVVHVAPTWADAAAWCDLMGGHVRDGRG